MSMLWVNTNQDAQVVRRVLSGHSDDYAVLVKRYLPTVQAVAYARMGNYADAQDVAQDAFFKAFQRLNTLRDTRKFGAWLMWPRARRRRTVRRRRLMLSSSPTQRKVKAQRSASKRPSGS